MSGAETGGEAALWHHLASHLTEAHGTNPGAIEDYAPTLGQLRCEHWTAHLTHDATGLMFQHSHQPHSHPDPLSEGERYRAPESYAPFPASLSWQTADPWAARGQDISRNCSRVVPRELEPEAGA